MANVKMSSIYKKFGNTEVIHGIDLEVEDNEFVVFVGPSGCGKSTLLRLIAGLEDVTEGNIEIDGIQVNSLPPAKRGIAMVFQSYALYPHMNVYENMSFGLKNEKIDKNEIDKKVKDAAKTLQIENLLERKPRQLSGGQRQRVAIGRAITRNPKLFLFDEPLSNLDAALRSEMRVEISKLHKKLSTNMIYVTHDQVEAMTLADKIVILNQGVMQQYGSPDEIYNNPNNIFVAEFIGSPRMNIFKIDKEKIKNQNSVNIFNNNIKFDNYKFLDDVYMGIRPEHIRVDDSGDIKFNVKIDLIENLGFEKIIYATLDGKEFRIKTSKNISKNHSQISFLKENIYFFDINKKRIYGN